MQGRAVSAAALAAFDALAPGMFAFVAVLHGFDHYPL